MKEISNLNDEEKFGLVKFMLERNSVLLYSLFVSKLKFI
jgi:hypothetical protein